MLDGVKPRAKEDPAYIAHDNAPGLLRVIDRYASEDGLHFDERKRVIQRDARDPVDQQFYHLFHTGVNSAHNGKHSHGPPRTVIMYATTDSIWA